MLGGKPIRLGSPLAHPLGVARVSDSPITKLLRKVGLPYLAKNAAYMFYPNDPSRSAGNRHYLYIPGTGWTETGSAIDGTMLVTGAISGGAGTHTITLPANTASRVQVIWESTYVHQVAFEIGFNRVLTASEQAAFAATSFLTQLLAGTGLTISGCRAVYTGDGYYVDSVHGNDENAGGITAPFATIAAAVAADTGSNKSSLYLASGSSWRYAYQVPRASMSVVGYGRGAKPLLDASDAIAAESWSKTDGRTNVYQCTVALSYGGTTQVQLFENAAHLSRKTANDVAAVDAAEGSYCLAEETGETITIYVYATGGGDPASNGKTYEYSARKQSINSDYEYVTICGIHARRGNNSDGPIRAVRYATIEHCLSEFAATHLYYFQSGSRLVSCVAHNGGTGMYVCHDTDGLGGLDFELIDCLAYNDADLAGLGTGLLVHNGGLAADRFGTIRLERFTAIDVVKGVSVSQTDLLHLIDCEIYDGVCNCVADTSGELRVEGGTFAIGRSGSTGRIFDLSTNASDITTAMVLDVSDVVSQNGDFPAGILTAPRSVAMLFNDCIFTGNDLYGIRRTTATGGSLSVSGCEFDCKPYATSFVYALEVAIDSIVSDNNEFTSGMSRFKIANATYGNLAYYRDVVGKDANSTPANSTQLLPSPAPTDLTVWTSQGGTRYTDRFIENTQNTDHRVEYAISPALAVGGLYCAYLEVKPAGRTWVYLRSPRGAEGSWFELTGDGALGAQTNTPYARGIVALDNGYYGIWLSSLFGSNTAIHGLSLTLALADSGGAYAGDNTSGVYVRLAKLCEGDTPL